MTAHCKKPGRLFDTTRQTSEGGPFDRTKETSERVIGGSPQEAGETVRQDERDNIGCWPFDGTRETS